jgi:hypothetical protein
MIHRFILPILLAVGLLALPASVRAGNTSKPKPTPNHHHVTIEAVSPDSITVNQPGGSKTYKIALSTEITFKGQTVTVDQLQVGMRVQVTPDAVDETVAGEIIADDPPHDPTPIPRVTPPAAWNNTTK